MERFYVHVGRGHAREVYIGKQYSHGMMVAESGRWTVDGKNFVQVEEMLKGVAFEYRDFLRRFSKDPTGCLHFDVLVVSGAGDRLFRWSVYSTYGDINGYFQDSADSKQETRKLSAPPSADSLVEELKWHVRDFTVAVEKLSKNT